MGLSMLTVKIISCQGSAGMLMKLSQDKDMSKDLLRTVLTEAMKTILSKEISYSLS